MKDYQRGIIEALLSIPKKNLEDRIIELEKEIEERLSIKEMIISDLQYKRMMLTGQLSIFQHLGYGFLKNMEVAENQILKVNGMIQEELVGSFRDLSALKEKLRDAKGQLLKEKLKSSLIK